MFNSKSKPVTRVKPANPPSPQKIEENHGGPTKTTDDGNHGNCDNHLSAGTVIEGNIVSSEDLYLDGRVNGDIRTTARLYLGVDSHIEGNIIAADAEVAGRITGTVECEGLLTIKSTCVIEGDIVTKCLNVESGSSFNGRCKVGESVAPEADSTVTGSTVTGGTVEKRLQAMTAPSQSETKTEEEGELVFG